LLGSDYLVISTLKRTPKICRVRWSRARLTILTGSKKYLYTKRELLHQQTIKRV